MAPSSSLCHSQRLRPSSRPVSRQLPQPRSQTCQPGHSHRLLTSRQQQQSSPMSQRRWQRSPVDSDQQRLQMSQGQLQSSRVFRRQLKTSCMSQQQQQMLRLILCRLPLQVWRGYLRLLLLLLVGRRR